MVDSIVLEMPFQCTTGPCGVPWCSGTDENMPGHQNMPNVISDMYVLPVLGPSPPTITGQAGALPHGTMACCLYI